MNTPAKVATSAIAKKKGKRPPSARRLAAQSQVDAAKSDQEKTVARSHLKIVRFDELATPRVRRALKALDTIANLANRSAYTYTDEQAKKIEQHLMTRVAAVIGKFKGEKAKTEEITI
jgi:hypothetical protein